MTTKQTAFALLLLVVAFTGYSQDCVAGESDYVPGIAQVSLMDDEVVKNTNNEYVIVMSRPQDRPSNATAANGVTWVDWGPESFLGFTIRWLTIKPEWSFPKSPTEPDIGYNADPAAKSYDPTLIDCNNRDGYLGECQPVVGYVTKEEIEAIGETITPEKIPAY